MWFIEKEYNKDISEILLNLKILCFINPDNIYNIYKKKLTVCCVLRKD